MKLLTHNMLACHIKGVTNGYPFKIEVVKVEKHEADFDPGTLSIRSLCRVGLPALMLCLHTSLPIVLCSLYPLLSDVTGHAQTS